MLPNRCPGIRLPTDTGYREITNDMGDAYRPFLRPFSIAFIKIDNYLTRWLNKRNLTIVSQTYVTDFAFICSCWRQHIKDKDICGLLLSLSHIAQLNKENIWLYPLLLIVLMSPMTAHSVINLIKTMMLNNLIPFFYFNEKIVDYLIRLSPQPCFKRSLSHKL